MSRSSFPMTGTETSTTRRARRGPASILAAARPATTQSAAASRGSLVFAAVLCLAAGLAGPAVGQINYLAWNNGSDNLLVLPGVIGSGSLPNLYYRCFPAESLYPPEGTGGGGLDVTGFQIALHRSARPPGLGFPIAFFVEDPGRTCILSAAIGGGFPPNKAKILQSSKTLATLSFYTSFPSANFLWYWITFTGSSALFQAPDPSTGGGNLLAGWSGRENTTTWDFTYPIDSIDEAAAAPSRSYVNLNGSGQGLLRLASTQEWGMEPILGVPSIQPEVLRPDGSWDLGGSGGYSPAVGPRKQLRFRTMDTGHAGTGVFPIHVANLTFQASASACHVPGMTLFGVHLPVNVDFFWILTFGLLQGPPLTPAGPILNWNPNVGWSPGGESVSPPLLITLQGLIGLQMCFGSYAFDPAGPPFVVAASNGSTLRFR